MKTRTKSATIDSSEAIDRLIRDGKEAEAQAALQSWIALGIARESLAKVTALCRRANLALLGARLLHRLVRPSGKALVAATDDERAEYAACLSFLGAVEEATTILLALDPNRLPKVRLYRVLALFAEWDYAGAIPLLTEYLAAPTDPYARLVATINLADALVNERQDDEATRILNGLLRDTGLAPYPLLRGRAALISAQHAIDTARWEDARRALGEASGIFRNGTSIQGMLVRKARGVLEYLTQGHSAVGTLDAIRRESAAIGYWEGIRDCDRVQALATRDRALFMRLFVGTPYAGFRSRLAREFGETPADGEPYVWRFADPSENPPVLDLETGTIDGNAVPLKVGQIVHRLLVGLAADFYRPFRLAALHHYLHPHEHFNPLSSPSRVRDTLKRLRAWLDDTGFPLDISHRDGEYRLSAHAPCALRLRALTAKDRQSLLARRLRDRWVTGAFSARQAGELLQISTRTAQRVLQTEVLQSRLEKIRAGGSTLYRFTGKKAA